MLRILSFSSTVCTVLVGGVARYLLESSQKSGTIEKCLEGCFSSHVLFLLLPNSPPQLLHWKIKYCTYLYYIVIVVQLLKREQGAPRPMGGSGSNLSPLSILFLRLSAALAEYLLRHWHSRSASCALRRRRSASSTPADAALCRRSCSAQRRIILAQWKPEEVASAKQQASPPLSTLSLFIVACGGRRRRRPLAQLIHPNLMLDTARDKSPAFGRIFNWDYLGIIVPTTTHFLSSPIC